MASPSANFRATRTRLLLAGLALVALAILNLLGALRFGTGKEKEQPDPLAPRGRIQGVVSGADGKPEQARVRLQQYTLGGKGETVATDDRGAFKVEGLPYGRYWVTIRGDLVADVELTPSQPTVVATLHAPAWSVLRGVVREKETGQPVPGALVVLNLPSASSDNWRYSEVGDRFEWAHCTVPQLIQRATDQQAPFAVADRQGRYQLKLGDEHGTLCAIAPKKGLLPQSESLPVAVRGVGQQDFAMEPTRKALVRGRVTLPDGTPLARGKVRFYTRRQPDRVYDLTTDAEGHYAFLPSSSLSGTAWLEVAGYAPMHQYVPSDKGPPFPRVDWVLKPPQTGKLIVSILRPDGKTAVPDGYKVSYMRSSDPQPDKPREGTPGPHIYYRWEADQWGRSGSSLTVNNGKAQGDLEPGIYSLSLPPFPLTDTPENGRKDLTSYFSRDAGQIKVTIEPTRTTERVLTVPLPSAVTIKVKTPDGQVVPGINLAAFQWNPESLSYGGTWGTTATNDQGQVLFDPLPPGQYVFHAATGGTDYEPLRRYPITLQAGKHHHLDMVLDKHDIDLLKKRLQGPVRLRGQVLMPDGATPAAFAAIYQGRAHSWIDESRPTVVADAQGRFTLETWGSGPLTIWARSHDTALTSTTIPDPTKEPDSVRLVLEAGRTIPGRVVPGDDTPASAFRIAALSEPSLTEPSSIGMPHGPPGHALTTPVRPDGSFTLYGVSSGTRYLCLYRKGRLQLGSLQSLEIREGEEKQVRLTVEPECAGVEIHFQRADGKPMPEFYEARLYTPYGSLYCGGLDEKRDIARSRAPLPAGRYYLWLDTTSVKQGLEMLPGLIERNIQVRPGKTFQKIDISLPPAGAVQGRVVLPDGTPAAALRVRVLVEQLPAERGPYAPLPLVLDSKAAPCYAETWIDPEGAFTLFGLVPGRYRLAVCWSGREEALFVSDPVDVQGRRVTQAGTWTMRPK